jgi:hypothetical protein
VDKFEHSESKTGSILYAKRRQIHFLYSKQIMVEILVKINDISAKSLKEGIGTDHFLFNLVFCCGWHNNLDTPQPVCISLAAEIMQ